MQPENPLRRLVECAFVAICLATLLVIAITAVASCTTPAPSPEVAPAVGCAEAGRSLLASQEAAGYAPHSHQMTPVGELVTFSNPTGAILRGFFLAWDAPVAEAMTQRGWEVVGSCRGEDGSASTILTRAVQVPVEASEGPK